MPWILSFNHEGLKLLVALEQAVCVGNVLNTNDSAATPCPSYRWLCIQAIRMPAVTPGWAGQAVV